MPDHPRLLITGKEIAEHNQKVQKDFEEADAEILTLFKGFDDTYSQIVHSRKSFMYDEILWGKRFVSIIGQNDEGKTSLALDKMNEMQNAELPLHISLKESQAL